MWFLPWLACRPVPVVAPHLLPAGDAGERLVRPPEVRWQARIGATTYRSAILIDGDRVVVGSNGAALQGEDDAEDGLYVLDARTGARIHQVVPPGPGERDVTGVAAADGAWFAGTDQGAVHRIGADGTVAWSAPTSGDVEGTPVLYDADGDGGLDVAVAVEQGPLVVLDGDSGAPLLSIDDGPHFAAPAAADVTRDGVPELFVPLRDGRLYAADGRTGEVLWSHHGAARFHGPPILVDADDDGDLDLLAPRWEGRIDVIDPADGAVLDAWPVSDAWLYAVGWFPDARCAVAGTASKEGVDNALVCVDPEGERWRRALLPTRVPAAPVVGDLDGRPGDEVLFGAENGQVFALDAAGATVWTWRAPGPVECPPALGDLDGDGRTEVLVASTDGTLTALATRGRAPATVGHWRGDPRNTGVLLPLAAEAR